MARRMYTLATVHFQHRVPEEQHDRMMVAVAEAGVSQDIVVETMRNRLLHICRAAARAMTDEMCKWPAEQWRVECENVRVASVPKDAADGQD